MSQNSLNNETYDASFNVTKQASSAGSSSSLIVTHLDNTNPASEVNVLLANPAASTADLYVQAASAGTSGWAWGIDTSDTFALKETTGVSPTPSGGTLTRKVFITGEQIMPLQPAFSATLTVSATNATGNGGVYVLGNNSGGTTTVVTDQGSNTSFPGGNLTFTAPVTGFYMFNWCFGVTGISALMTDAICFMTVTGPTNYTGLKSNPSSIAPPAASNGFGTFVGSHALALTAGNTVIFTIILTGGAADSCGIDGTSFSTFASGYLVC